jgi:ABC-type sugar transport system ATPase subunit
MAATTVRLFLPGRRSSRHIRDTERKGIAIIHQELALVKHLTVLENIFLGAEVSRHGVLDYDTMTLRCENCSLRSIWRFRRIPE